jgi:DNA-3-methyladenine glycosylase II
MKISGPYNFDLVLDRLSLDPLHVVDRERRSVKVPLIISGKPQIVEVKAVGSTDKPEFIIIGGDTPEAIDKVTHIFQWNRPLQDIHNHFQTTDLKSIFEKHRGTPLVLDFDPYNCLLKCIVHQQLNLAFAHTLTERFVKTFGFEEDGVLFYPQPETVANLKVEDLRELQFSGRKAEYVIGVAREIVNGNLDLHSLHEKTDEEIMKELVKLRGVGPWTVQNLLMFGLGRPNLFPAADIGLQNALKKLYNLEKKPTLEEMEKYKQDWEPYLSYASLYLWRSLEEAM